jgi:hypothetical protein
VSGMIFALELASILLTPVWASIAYMIVWRFPSGRRFIVDLMSREEERASNLAALGIPTNERES